MISAAFQEALTVARKGYAPKIWEAMSLAERTSAIYREMRRTDAERTKREQGSSGKDPDVRVSASDPTYICFCLSPARQVIGCLGIDAADPQEAWDEAHDRWKDLAAADVIEVLLDGRVVHRASTSRQSRTTSQVA